MYKYKIGDKIYIQRPLVLGQIRQLMSIVETLVIPRDIDTLGLITILGDKLPLALAVVLTPEGMNLKDKDIHALASEIEFEISPETAIQVVEDFFDCNPIASIFSKIGEMAEKLNSAMTKQKTGLTSLSASSPEETLQKEMQYCGDTH